MFDLYLVQKKSAAASPFFCFLWRLSQQLWPETHPAHLLKAGKVISYACQGISASTMSLFIFVLFYVKSVFILLWCITWCQDVAATVGAFVV